MHFRANKFIFSRLLSLLISLIILTQIKFTTLDYQFPNLYDPGTNKKMCLTEYTQPYCVYNSNLWISCVSYVEMICLAEQTLGIVILDCLSSLFRKVKNYSNLLRKTMSEVMIVIILNERILIVLYF